MESITVSARTCLRTSPPLFVDPSDAKRSKCSEAIYGLHGLAANGCLHHVTNTASNEHNDKTNISYV
ncbi:hypothetical protein OUZ56_014437 [Daphnia magna]|uniref:Uncharacterized protein n=1 Tax=Daphnia magna TaxID=35525 RepID=A0ABR0AJR6_9CRUS|nr:hypothetical protein OUZ56_014437 [Daphnia magna]